jgi:hypothetical protein
MNNKIIDTGAPRNVTGHVVSGALVSAILAGATNYKKVKEGKVTPNDAVKDTVKRTAQGGIVTGSAIAAANYLGQPNGLMKAVSAVSIGLAGAYAIEVMDDVLTNKYEQPALENAEENIESIEE